MRGARVDRETLRGLYCDEGLSQRQIGERYGVGQGTIQYWMAKHGIERRPKCGPHPDSPDAETLRRMYWGDGMSLPEVAKVFSMCRSAVGRLMGRLGVPRRPRKPYRVCCPPATFREDAFDSITEGSAYWVGFLMADGCVIENRQGQRAVRLALAGKDREHVEAFQGFLGTQYKIGAYGDPRLPQVGFSVISDRIADALAKFGVTPRKTFTARVSGLEFDRHFWRGVIDGDGSLSQYKKRPVINLVGSPDLVEQFRVFCVSICPTAKCRVSGKYERTAQICFTGAQAIAIIRHLYSDATICLPRKRERAEQILRDGFTRRRFDWSSVSLASIEAAKERLGSWQAVAEAFGVSKSSVTHFVNRQRHLSAT